MAAAVTTSPATEGEIGTAVDIVATGFGATAAVHADVEFPDGVASAHYVGTCTGGAFTWSAAFTPSNPGIAKITVAEDDGSPTVTIEYEVFA